MIDAMFRTTSYLQEYNYIVCKAYAARGTFQRTEFHIPSKNMQLMEPFREQKSALHQRIWCFVG